MELNISADPQRIRTVAESPLGVSPLEKLLRALFLGLGGSTCFWGHPRGSPADPRAGLVLRRGEGVHKLHVAQRPGVVGVDGGHHLRSGAKLKC